MNLHPFRTPALLALSLLWGTASTSAQTLAFISSEKNNAITVIGLADMKPQTTDSHCSAKPVRYVLEMNKGWFTKKGIKAGFKLAGKPFENVK